MLRPAEAFFFGSGPQLFTLPTPKLRGHNAKDLMLKSKLYFLSPNEIRRILSDYNTFNGNAECVFILQSVFTNRNHNELGLDNKTQSYFNIRRCIVWFFISIIIILISISRTVAWQDLSAFDHYRRERARIDEEIGRLRNSASSQEKVEENNAIEEFIGEQDGRKFIFNR